MPGVGRKITAGARQVYKKAHFVLGGVDGNAHILGRGPGFFVGLVPSHVQVQSPYPGMAGGRKIQGDPVRVQVGRFFFEGGIDFLGQGFGLAPRPVGEALAAVKVKPPRPAWAVGHKVQPVAVGRYAGLAFPAVRLVDAAGYGHEGAPVVPVFLAPENVAVAVAGGGVFANG